MNTFWLGLLSIIASGILGIILIHFFFRKTLVHGLSLNIAYVIIGIGSVCWIGGQKGVEVIIYSAPFSVTFGILSFYNIYIKVKKPISYLSDLISEMSHKNYNIKIEDKYYKSKYEIKEIVDSIDSLIKTNNDLLNMLDNNSKNVFDSSKTIKSSSNLISSSTTQQASSMEEASSSLEEMVANIQSNTQNATESMNISNKTNVHLGNSVKQIQESVTIINNIHAKTKILTEIADQTKILALNASIEAAKSGDVGKGFTVVASEIRKLAELSNDAANDIINESKNSVDIVTKISNDITNFKKEMDKSTNLVVEVATANKELSIGAEQINSAMQENTNSIQYSAAMSQELDSTATNLYNYADNLTKFIKKYNYIKS